MHNVNTGMVPSFIQDFIPPLVSEVSDYPLRNTRNITVPYNQTSISQKSCISSSIRLWNSLADDLKDSSSLLTFKKHVISNFNISCVPPYLLWETDIALLYMHGLEIIVVVLTMIFLETMFVITLYVNGVVLWRMPPISSFIVLNIYWWKTGFQWYS